MYNFNCSFIYSGLKSVFYSCNLISVIFTFKASLITSIISLIMSKAWQFLKHCHLPSFYHNYSKYIMGTIIDFCVYNCSSDWGCSDACGPNEHLWIELEVFGKLDFFIVCNNWNKSTVYCEWILHLHMFLLV